MYKTEQFNKAAAAVTRKGGKFSLYLPEAELQPLPIGHDAVQPCCQCHLTSACNTILGWYPFDLWGIQDIDFYILRDDFSSARHSWTLKP